MLGLHLSHGQERQRAQKPKWALVITGVSLGACQICFYCLLPSAYLKEKVYQATLCISLLLCMGFLQLQRVGTALQWRCLGISLQGLLLLQSTGSRARGPQSLWHTGPAALGHAESSWTRIQPMSPALAGVFLSTGPPGTPHCCFNKG